MEIESTEISHDTFQYSSVRPKHKSARPNKTWCVPNILPVGYRLPLGIKFSRLLRSDAKQ